MSPTHLSIIGCAFIWENVVRCVVSVVHYSQFGGVRYSGAENAVRLHPWWFIMEEVRYWEGLLLEVPLHFLNFVSFMHEKFFTWQFDFNKMSWEIP